MPGTEYLCIDDQQDQTIEVLLESLSRGNLLSFDRQTPVELGLQLDQISAAAAAAANKDNRFGLLLDLRLDTEADVHGNKVPYRGPTLAQELRTRMMENDMRSFPIILWSINEKFVNSFDRDDTSHDLFDAVYGKDDLISRQPQLVARQMIALSEGYSRLEMLGVINTQTSMQCLNLTEDDLLGIHAAFLDEYLLAMKTQSRHEVAYLLLGDLIRMPGLLVEEEMVAARLGVDMCKSSEGWAILKNYFDSAAYRGPFEGGWPRWWWFKIEDWWNGFSETQPNLRRLTAEDRVNLLNSRFNLNLVAALPIESGYSTKFFSLCVATRSPLDPADGLRVIKKNRKSWHDTPYVSIYAALERIEKDNWRIDPLDREHFDQLKTQTED